MLLMMLALWHGTIDGEVIAALYSILAVIIFFE